MLVLLTFGGGGGGGVVQNRESPDFRSPEVGRYALATPSSSPPPPTTRPNTRPDWYSNVVTFICAWFFFLIQIESF